MSSRLKLQIGDEHCDSVQAIEIDQNA
jgi:hypothetical protein